MLTLPAARVDDLVRARDGEPFSAGKGRPMRAWVALPWGRPDAVSLAREAYEFVAGGSAQGPA